MRDAACGTCRRFSNAPDELEAAFPGLTVLSSAYAAVRAADGLCAMHARYVASSSLCAHHQVRVVATSTRQS